MVSITFSMYPPSLDFPQLETLPQPTEENLRFLHYRFQNADTAQLLTPNPFTTHLKSMIQDYFQKTQELSRDINRLNAQKMIRIAHFTKDYLQIPDHALEFTLDNVPVSDKVKSLDINITLLAVMQQYHSPLYHLKEQYNEKNKPLQDNPLIWQLGRDNLYKNYLQFVLTFGTQIH